MTQTSWGRWDFGSLLTTGGAFIPVFGVFSEDFNVRNDILKELKTELLKDAEINSVSITPNGVDALITVEYKSGPVLVKGAKVVFANAVMSLYAAHKNEIDPSEGVSIVCSEVYSDPGDIPILPEVMKAFKL